MVGRVTWSVVEDAELKRMYLAGEAIDAIAQTLGRTTGSIKTRVSTLGLLRRKGAGSRMVFNHGRNREPQDWGLLNHPCFAS